MSEHSPPAPPAGSELTELHVAHATFVRLVAELRPELLRYAARMMGSTLEGDDVVQDTLAHAFYQLAELRELPAMRAWLFRIAHNRALNALLARSRHTVVAIDELESLPFDGPELDAEVARHEALGIAIDRFLELAPAQRASVILKDMLGCSLEETAVALDLTVPAVKAALFRGRTRLRELGATPASARPAHDPTLLRWVALFNARDWEGVRALLADDVRLDLVRREQRSGAGPVGGYVTNYASKTDWHLRPGWLEGRPVIAVLAGPGDVAARYLIALGVSGGQVRHIRDYRYARETLAEAVIELR